MSSYHLRHYFLKTEEAARKYLPIWHDHIASLAMLDIETNGFFAVLENPREVIAMIRFKDGVDPEEAIKAYMVTPAFKRDMEGFDMAQIERVEVLTLIAGPGSPLA